MVRYGTWLLERLVLRRFGYEGVYWDRAHQVGETMPLGKPSWEGAVEGFDPAGED